MDSINLTSTVRDVGTSDNIWRVKGLPFLPLSENACENNATFLLLGATSMLNMHVVKTLAERQIHTTNHFVSCRNRDPNFLFFWGGVPLSQNKPLHGVGIKTLGRCRSEHTQKCSWWFCQPHEPHSSHEAQSQQLIRPKHHRYIAYTLSACQWLF